MGFSKSDPTHHNEERSIKHICLRTEAQELLLLNHFYNSLVWFSHQIRQNKAAERVSRAYPPPPQLVPIQGQETD